MEAVMWGVDDAVISALLAQSVDLNARGWNGTTAPAWDHLVELRSTPARTALPTLSLGP
jgi:hypothetical protein